MFILQSGMALQELSKDKASMKAVENHTSQFLKTLSHVEGELSKHINYLTQVSTGNKREPFFNCSILIIYLIGQPHEGSSYGSTKMYKTARHRLDHTRTRLQELETLKNRALAASNRPASGQNN